MSQTDISSLPSQTYFEGTEHEFCLFASSAYLDANAYLEDQLPNDIPAEHPSWQWKVIGHFGTKGESVILEPQTGKLYLYCWNRYPVNQNFLAGSLDELINRLQMLTPAESVWDLT